MIRFVIQFLQRRTWRWLCYVDGQLAAESGRSYTSKRGARESITALCAVIRFSGDMDPSIDVERPPR